MKFQTRASFHVSALGWLLFCASSVRAHGQITSVKVDGVDYPGFNTYFIPDPNNKKTPVHRLTPNEIGYVRYRDVNTDKIICSESGLDPVPVTAPVKAGGKVQVQWLGDKFTDLKQWPHPSGPVISYMAPCDGPCSSFDVRKAKFFKIEEFGLDTTQRPSKALMDATKADNQPATGEGLWGASKLMQDNSLWTINIPNTIANGEYILRHEIITYQWTANDADPQSGAQYYPSCIQVSVSGGGSDRPQGILAKDLYTVGDGKFNLYENGGPKSFKVPGPAVFTPSAIRAPSAPPSTLVPTPTPTSQLVQDVDEPTLTPTPQSTVTVTVDEPTPRSTVTVTITPITSLPTETAVQTIPGFLICQAKKAHGARPRRKRGTRGASDDAGRLDPVVRGRLARHLGGWNIGKRSTLDSVVTADPEC